MATKKSKKEQETGFTKDQILASEKYADKRDILRVLLCDNCVYTEEKINSLIEKFMKGKVN